MKNRLYKRIMIYIITACMTVCIIGCGSKKKDQAEADDGAYTEDEVYDEDDYEDENEYDDSDDYYEYDENETYDDEDYYEDVKVESDNIGITFTLPEQYINTTGEVEYSDIELSEDDRLFFAVMNYIGLSADDYDNIINSDEESTLYSDSTVPILMIFAIDKEKIAAGNNDGGNASELAGIISENTGENLDESNLSYINQSDRYVFYEYESDDALNNYGNLNDEYKAEYDNLVSLKGDLLKNAEYNNPITGNERMVGEQVSFITTDLDGNIVNSDDIFAENEITMVNVWATWCGWCVGELPELQKINESLAAKNCAIVGLCGDSDDQEGLEEARNLIRENGVTYLNIRPFDDWNDVFNMDDGWPKSFFVDRNGVMITTPISGAMVDEYENHIDEALNGNTEHKVEGKNSYENSDNMYRIKVVDESSDPVVGAMVQFCTDDTCKMAVTDSDGTVTFNDPPGVYEVHVRKVPKGYDNNTTTYKTEDYYSDMVIVVNKD